MDENTPIIVKTDDLFVNNPKLEQVFSSIEKQLVAQTGFLKSMQGDISDQFKFNKDMVRKTESEKRRESVAGEDGSNPLEDERNEDSKKDSKKGPEVLGFGIGGLLGSIMAGVGMRNLLGVALRKTVPALLAPVIGAYINGAVTQGLLNSGATEESAAAIGDAVGTGVNWGIWGTLLFGKWGGLVGLMAGIGSRAGAIMDANQDNIIGAMMGKLGDKEWWDTWGAPIGAAVGILLMGFGKKLGVKLLSMGTAIVSAALLDYGITKPPVVTTTVPSTTLPPPATPPATPPAAAGKPLTQLGTVGEAAAARRAAAEVIPSGSNVGVTGKVVAFAKGKFKSIADIVEAMKSDPTKAAKLAKYAKFFKFAGPAMSVIPALIDPAMAIYNDESDEEIKKQIVGALGSVSGAYLGAIAGAGLTTLIPVVGQSGIGNLLGGIIGGVGGAMSGEYLTEELADALLGGPDPEPVDAVVEAIPTLNKSSETYSESVILKPSTTPSTAPAIEPVIPMQGKVAEIDRQQISIAGGGAGGGVNVNQMGGNVSNNTNVGGSSTTFNVFQGGGSSALSNSLPVNMTTA
jgi:hypothetical protein